MKALVLGCGSIGLRHISHLQQLGVSQIEAADLDDYACAKAREQKIWVTLHPEEALQRRPDVVLVCTPAPTHVDLAARAIQAGAHVFIEKPLCTTAAEGKELLRIAGRDGRVVQVGYNLRYHPAVRAAKKLVEEGRIGRVLTAHLEFGLYLGKWWKDRDYRASYMARSEAGGGLLLDSSHEIDLALFFLGRVSQAAGLAGKLSTLEIRGMDAVKGLLMMKSGAIVTLSMDCLQPTYTRTFFMVGEDAGLRWDCPVGRADSSLGRLLLCERGEESYSEVSVEGDPLATYLDELRDFFSSVQARRKPGVGLGEGLEVVRVAVALEEAVRTGQVVWIRD